MTMGGIPLCYPLYYLLLGRKWLLVAEGGDGIEQGGLEGGPEAEDNPHAGRGEKECEKSPPTTSEAGAGYRLKDGRVRARVHAFPIRHIPLGGRAL